MDEKIMNASQYAREIAKREWADYDAKVKAEQRRYGFIFYGAVIACVFGFLFLAGCNTTSRDTSSAVFSFKLTWCATNDPIRPTPEELAVKSDEQKRSDLAHNLKGADWCGWKP
jgi:hypothetical protein